MRIIKSKTRIDFLGQRHIAYAISAILIIVSIGSLLIQGLSLGVDFTGGVVVEVGYEQPAELDNVRAALAKGGYTDATVQFFGSTTDVMIRLGPQETQDTAKVSGAIMQALHADSSNAELRRVEYVGSQVGDELVGKGALALLYTLIGILVYVIVRFHWKLATGAVVALAHNVLVIVGMFSLFQWEVDLTVVAAVLAMIGYGVNDTIVTFDRVRENFPRMRKADAFEVMNTSINEMLARTIMTALTVILALMALLLVGGDAIQGFARAMLIGTVFGIYATVYVAGAVAMELDVTKEDIFPPKEEDGGHHVRDNR